MTPNTNHDNDINVWCDWLTDNGYNSDEIRFEQPNENWSYEYQYFIGAIGVFSDHTFDYCARVGTINSGISQRVGCASIYGSKVGPASGGDNAVGVSSVGYDFVEIHNVGSNI